MDSLDIKMVALQFNQKINQRDLDGLIELMTEGHIFIDNTGDVDTDVDTNNSQLDSSKKVKLAN